MQIKKDMVQPEWVDAQSTMGAGVVFRNLLSVLHYEGGEHCMASAFGRTSSAVVHVVAIG